ncbi:MAG: redoxin domain-containing protein [Chloroflexi bacterium]|nr:redoxin domain-containing protein [Chloroflexota bacterium]
MANVAVGQEAPDFTLRDENKQEVKLSEQRGTPVVLVFYSLDFSPLCTSEMCAYRDDISLFEGKGAKIYGISRDSTWTHKAFKEREGLTHTLLADMKGDVARLYGCWNEAAAMAERLTVVIDKDGKITYVEHNAPAQIRDQKKALAALA